MRKEYKYYFNSKGVMYFNFKGKRIHLNDFTLYQGKGMLSFTAFDGLVFHGCDHDNETVIVEYIKE